MAPVPEDFINLASLKGRPPSSSSYNVIGMVCDMLPEKVAKNGNLTLTFDIVDLSSVMGGRGLKVRFFAPPSSKDLPKIALGDIILLRHVRLTHYAGDAVIMNIPKTTQWSVFTQASLPKPEFAMAYMGNKQKLQSKDSSNYSTKTPLSLAQQKYIIDLANNYSNLSTVLKSTANAQPHAETRMTAEKRPALISDLNFDGRKRFQAARADKFRLIRDVQDNQYCDLVVEVVKKWSAMGGCELYVTDYTTNELLWDYPDPLDAQDGAGRDGDPYNYTDSLKTPWAGPWGTQVLKVVCKFPHSDYANDNVEVGQHVRLLNTKIKFNDRNLLEGTLWDDKKFPDKLYITVLQSGDLPEVKLIKQRKEEYYAARDTNAISRPVTNDEDIGERMTRKQRKKQRKKEKTEREAAEARAAAQSLEEQTLKPNEHIRCSNMTIPLSSVETILDLTNERHLHSLPDGRPYVLPFVNAKFRAKVRVLDFQPNNLEDFTMATDETEDNSMDLSIESSQSWKWSFTLLVQDATKMNPQKDDCVIVNVGHKEAEFLLLPEAANLREQPELLAQLREKLYILWGDLEERKSTEISIPPSNRPFECCISEYGLLKEGGALENVLDWERHYMLHGVTIV